jgi:hypothetical protein
MTPFDYPVSPHMRRHGPQGYKRPESFRPWLRDEFGFRCVYCLDRETWHVSTGHWVVEHFLPMVQYPQLALSYDNLQYVCISCNLTKNKRIVPDPLITLLRDTVVCDDDTGRIAGRTPAAAKLIEMMQLDSEECRATRRRWFRVLRVLPERDPDLYREVTAWPLTLPDLSLLRPPEGNSRPAGVHQSHYARRERGELNATM